MLFKYIPLDFLPIFNILAVLSFLFLFTLQMLFSPQLTVSFSVGFFFGTVKIICYRSAVYVITYDCIKILFVYRNVLITSTNIYTVFRYIHKNHEKKNFDATAHIIIAPLLFCHIFYECTQAFWVICVAVAINSVLAICAKNRKI